MTKWGNYGSGDGQFNTPYGLNIDKDGNVYVADSSNNRVQVFDLSGNFITKWGSYGQENGQFSFPTDVAFDSMGNIYVVDADNSRIQKFSKGSPAGGTIWQKDLPVSLASQETTATTETVGQLSTTGKLWLNATLKSSLGQTIAEDSYPFYIYPGDTAMTLETDKKIYKPGETINVSGVVTNNAQLPLLDRQLMISVGNDTIINENVLTLSPGESHFFSASFVASQSLSFKGIFDDVTIEDKIDVAAPQVEMTVDAPDVVGRDSFDFNVTLKNTGAVDADTVLEIIQDQQTISTETVSIPAGETRLIQKTYNLMSDSTFEVRLSGDAQAAFAAAVSFGENISVTLTPEAAYAEGQDVVVPYTINNTGELDSRFNLAAGVGNQMIVREVFVPAGESLAGSVNLRPLGVGGYEIAAATPFGATSETFEVKKEIDVELSVTTADSTAGKVIVRGSLNNVGLSNFTGSLKVSSNFHESKTALDINSGDTTAFEFTLDTAGAAPGIHDITVAVLDGGGNPIKEDIQQVEIKEAIFEADYGADPLHFALGQPSSMTFEVKNTGNLEGEASLTLNLTDVFKEEKSTWLAPGETTEVVFAFTVPNDIEGKDYKGAFSLNDQAPQEFIYHVNGINLEVDVSVDKAVYLPGETATVTLNINNISGLADLTLTAQARIGTEETEQKFNMTQSSRVILSLPVESEEKLSYGIYAEGGRAAYLNSTYIRVAGKPVNLIPDKAIYRPGDTVTVDVQTSTVGTLSVKAPGLNRQINIQGPTRFSFPLPAEMSTGTYLIDFELGQEKGAVAFDVAGTDIKVADFQLDKTQVAPGEVVTSKMLLESNTTFTAGLRMIIIGPDGETTEAVLKSVDIVPGENSIETSFVVTGSEPGLYELGYLLTKNSLTLVAGRAGFDIVGPSLVSIGTNQPSYKPGEDVGIYLDAFSAEPAPGQVSVYVDDILVKEEPIVIQGYQWLPLNIGKQALGTHTLKVRLSSGLVGGEKTLSFTVADSEAPTTIVSYQGVPGRNDWFTSDVTLTLAALDTNAGAGIDRIEYKLDDATWTPYIGPLYFGAEETHDLLYRAVDLAGNIEFAKSKKIKVDKTQPETLATLSGTRGVNGWYTSDVVVSLAATDSLSGADAINYSADGGLTWTPYSMPFILSNEGIVDLLFRAEDMAGNIEATKTVAVKIDKTAPEAGIKFDPTTEDITVSGYDNLLGPVAVNFAEVDKDHDDEHDDDEHDDEHGDEEREQRAGKAKKGDHGDDDKRDDDDHGKQTRKYTLIDEAGNTTRLVIEVQKEDRELKAEIKSMSYNSVATAKTTKNNLKFEWSFKNQSLKELEQYIKVTHQFKLKAKYKSKKNTTKIEIEENGLKQEERRSGLILVGLKTLSGQLLTLIE